LPTLRAEDGLKPTFGAGTTSFAAVAAANIAPAAKPTLTPVTGADSQTKITATTNGDEDPPGWSAAWSDDEADTTEAGRDTTEAGRDSGFEEMDSGPAKRAAAAAGEDAIAVGAGASRLLRHTRPLEMPRCRLAQLLEARDEQLSTKCGGEAGLEA